jgi:hypothetical protein
MELDPDQLRLDWSQVPDSQVPARKVKGTVEKRRKRRFIPPVPMEWFDRACVLPGKALAVSLILWRLSKVRKTPTVVLTNAALKQHGLNRWEKYDALAALEGAGLISVRRRGTRNPEVTILDRPGGSG